MRRPPGILTPLLWADCTECSLAEEHVLMRSVSLPGAVGRGAGRCRESVSPGKVKDPGLLAGEAGTEFQKEPPFCRGLPGVSLEAVAESGECSGDDPAPGRGLPIGRAPRLLRGTRLSSEATRLSLVAVVLGSKLVPLQGLSGTFVLEVGSASRGTGLLAGAGSGGPGVDVPDILSASAGLGAAEETSTGEWWRTGCGIREGLLRPEPGRPPLWFLWYSMGDVKAVKETEYA